MYGCFEYHNKVGSNELEQGNNRALQAGVPKNFNVRASRHCPPRKIAGFWAYVFQIIFQVT